MTNGLCAALMLFSTAAMLTAQTRPRSNFHYISEGPGGEMNGASPAQTYFLTFGETSQKGKNKFEGAWLSFSLCLQSLPDNSGNVHTSCVNGNGPVPATAISKEQRSRLAPTAISIDIADLTALGLFVLDGYTCDPSCRQIVQFPSPFSFSAALRATDEIKIDEDVSRTTEFQMPDGSRSQDIVRGRLNWSSAIGNAIIGGIPVEPGTFARTYDQRSAVHITTVTKP